MIRKDHMFWLKTTIGQLSEGDIVYLREGGLPYGTVHDAFSVQTVRSTVQESLPSEKFRFVLREEDADPRKGADRPHYVFQQFHEEHTCFRKVRADEIAGLISKEKDPL